MPDPRLALFGAAPAFDTELHVGRPNIGDRESLRRLIDDMLDRQWFTNDGPYVQELEQAIAARLGVRNVVAMCNGTVALEIATRALGLAGEVIVPSFTFVATAHALQWQEITPIFCDVDPRSHTLDPQRVEQLITPRTTGIIGVHLWGRPCDVPALQAVANDHGLALLFDAAHAFDCTLGDTAIGGFGVCEVLSFHATKFFNTFEGGAVATNDDDLAAKMRLMRNFGFAGFDEVIYIGTNGKMTEVSAAMGLVGLSNLGSFVETNVSNYEAYRDALSGVPGLTLLQPDAYGRSNHQYIVCEIDSDGCPLSRDELLRVLHSERVLARRYFFPGVHRMEPYRSYFPNAGLLLRETERLTERVLVLPTGTSVRPDDAQKVADIIVTAVAHADRVRLVVTEA